jgi:hypothetical protein
MTMECDCGTGLNENDECPACLEEFERQRAEFAALYRSGALEPPGPWKSREDIIRNQFWED